MGNPEIGGPEKFEARHSLELEPDGLYVTAKKLHLLLCHECVFEVCTFSATNLTQQWLNKASTLISDCKGDFEEVARFLDRLENIQNVH